LIEKRGEGDQGSMVPGSDAGAGPRVWADRPRAPPGRGWATVGPGPSPGARPPGVPPRCSPEVRPQNRSWSRPVIKLFPFSKPSWGVM